MAVEAIDPLCPTDTFPPPRGAARRCLVLGGSGLLGRALRRRKPTHHDLIATHFRHPIEASLAFDMRELRAIPSEDFDIVVMAIPLAKILKEQAGSAMRDAACRVCEGLARKRVVLLSTDAVFSGRVGNYDETASPDPITDYGSSQGLVDEIFLQTCPNGLVVRTSFLFGGRPPHLDKRLAPFLAGSAAVRSQQWPCNIYRSPTEVDFCAEAVWRCIDRGIVGIMNVCGERMSVYDFFVHALSHRTDLDMPDPWTDTRKDIAVDTSLSPNRMDQLLNLHHTLGWQWYVARVGGLSGQCG